MAGVLVAAALHVVIALGAHTPSFPFDEVVLLQYAKFFAGEGMPTPPRGAGYFPAWGLLMAPVWWLTEDPALAYRLAIGLGVVVALVTIWPLARALTRTGLGTGPSVAVAALVMSMPSRTLQSGYVTSEKLLFLALVLTMLAALRCAERPTADRAAVLAAAAVLLTATHARAVVLALACAVWLLCLAVRSPRAALVGNALLLPLAGLAFVTGGWLNRYLGGGFAQGEGLADNLLSARPSIIARAAVGQGWEQIAGSLGLVVVGLLVLLALVVRELRHERAIGPACLLGAMLLGTVLLSVGRWSEEHAMYLAGWRRLDAWLYGRYLDPVCALLVALALAALLRGLRRRTLVTALVLTAAAVGVTVLWLAPDAPTWGYVTPAHIPGVMPWFWALPVHSGADWPWGLVPTLANANRFWLLASLPALLLLGALAAHGPLRRRGSAALVCVLLALAAAGTLASTRATDHFQHLEGGRPELATALNALQADHGGGLTVELDLSCTPGRSDDAVVQNRLAYWIHPTTLGVTEDRGASAAQITLGCDIWPEGSARGARMLRDVESYGYHAWVEPGPLQDELAAQGALEPLPGV